MTSEFLGQWMGHFATNFPKSIIALLLFPSPPQSPPSSSLSGLSLSLSQTQTHRDVFQHCIWINHKTSDNSISSFLVLLNSYQWILTTIDPDLQGSYPHLHDLHSMANVVFSRELFIRGSKLWDGYIEWGNIHIRQYWLSGRCWNVYIGLREGSKKPLVTSDILPRLDLPEGSPPPFTVNHLPWGDTVIHSTPIYLIPVFQ